MLRYCIKYRSKFMSWFNEWISSENIPLDFEFNDLLWVWEMIHVKLLVIMNEWMSKERFGIKRRIECLLFCSWPCPIFSFLGIRESMWNWLTFLCQ
jgi:hypothetical protein